MSSLEIEQRLAPASVALSRGYTSEGIDLMIDSLSQIRSEAGESWKSVITAIRSMSLFETAQACPFANHSFLKPRGYPGDALLLDWIYRDFRLLRSPEPDSFAALVYRRTSACPAATAVRWRRQHIASLIDDVAMKVSSPSVLAIACGHLREADLSVSLQRGKVKRIVALDQDAESLREVDLRYKAAGMPVETVKAAISDVIVGRYKISGFDLIYSAGLYDYLEDKVARKLTNKLFDGLNPGGQLILTNFLHGTPHIGWVEAIMDWFLIYRDMDQIRAFASDIPKARIAFEHAYQCPTRSIGYLSLRKAE